MDNVARKNSDHQSSLERSGNISFGGDAMKNPYVAHVRCYVLHFRGFTVPRVLIGVVRS